MELYYPKAKQIPLVDHSSPGVLKQKNTIVLHITQGSTAIGAIETFKSSKRKIDGGKGRVSAHFIVDRDGTVYQLLPVSDTGFHASQANTCSVGIEHVAISKKLLCTEAQYVASSELVRWLCDGLGIAVDRAHVRTHNEASPRDLHVECCTGALDPDKVVQMAASVAVKGEDNAV